MTQKEFPKYISYCESKEEPVLKEGCGGALYFKREYEEGGVRYADYRYPNECGAWTLTYVKLDEDGNPYRDRDGFLHHLNGKYVVLTEEEFVYAYRHYYGDGYPRLTLKQLLA